MVISKKSNKLTRLSKSFNEVQTFDPFREVKPSEDLSVCCSALKLEIQCQLY